MAGLQTGGRDEPEVLAVPTLTLEMPSNHGFVWAGRLARRCQSPSGDSGGDPTCHAQPPWRFRGPSLQPQLSLLLVRVFVHRRRAHGDSDHPHPNLTRLIGDDPISKQGPMLRLQVTVTLGGRPDSVQTFIHVPAFCDRGPPPRASSRMAPVSLLDHRGGRGERGTWLSVPLAVASGHE